MITYYICIIITMFMSIIILFPLENNNLFDKEFIIPKLYRLTKMNIFGCIMTYIFLIIIDPLLIIPLDLYKIIYWLFHVGRKI